jgi:GH15 family glucan-1,4-alpha-glucosidase
VPLRIEDYALIGNTRTAALVGKDGSIDWMCVPRFDSNAVFAALLGDQGNGHWQIGPARGVASARRAYRKGTLILETELETADGAITLIDFMPVWPDRTDLVRSVACTRGSMPIRMELVIRLG